MSIKAVVVLHEIYGINEFIQGQCRKFREAGYEVLCPNLINMPPFSYEKSAEAYDYFIKHVGFEVYREIVALVSQLKKKYDHVFIIGFSVGATIAWRCSEYSLCDGIIACYGSRIRDYTDISPLCPTLLLFAKEDSFDILILMSRLREKQNLCINEFDAEHGFMDCYTKHYSPQQSKRAQDLIAHFLNTHTR